MQENQRCKFDPWVKKIPWRRAWQPNPEFGIGGPLLSSRIWKQRAPPKQMSTPDKVRKLLAVITSCNRWTQASTPPGAHGLTRARQEAAKAQKGGGV